MRREGRVGEGRGGGEVVERRVGGGGAVKGVFLQGEKKTGGWVGGWGCSYICLDMYPYTRPPLLFIKGGG